jgi:Fe2+ transport system protein FeoA
MYSGDLASAPLNMRLTICTLTLEPSDLRWVSAVGLHVGEKLVVLRRGLLRGPLHVQVDCGAEFAVGYKLAELVQVTEVTA